LSTQFRLRLPRPIHAALVAQALAERPNECCGLLAGRVTGDVGEVVRHYPLVNALASPTEFESEPRSMFAAVRDLHQRGLEVLAVYHSHPTSEPVPSRTDLARNYSTEVMNLIIGLAGLHPAIGCWWLTETGYRAAAWEVMD
jgi:proteasome lid subunit RPN8/RPN11